MTVINGQKWLCLFVIPCIGKKIYGGFWLYHSKWNMEIHYCTKGQKNTFTSVINETSSASHFDIRSAEKLVKHLAGHFPAIANPKIIPIDGDPLDALNIYRNIGSHQHSLPILN